ncbi:hypothetical protein SD80_012520 [Scytonema tolypothrichoides VB-61278]|nr:hypothetical protein SD80_012520 [Scytonema tolypothrichoides VB-61278]
MLNLKTGDFVKVTNKDLLYCLNGIVALADESEGKARIFCPELEDEFVVGEEETFSLHQSEDGNFLVKKVQSE